MVSLPSVQRVPPYGKHSFTCLRNLPSHLLPFAVLRLSATSYISLLSLLWLASWILLTLSPSQLVLLFPQKNLYYYSLPTTAMDPTKAQTTATFAHLKAQKANKVRSHFTPFSHPSFIIHGTVTDLVVFNSNASTAKLKTPPGRPSHSASTSVLTAPRSIVTWESTSRSYAPPISTLGLSNNFVP